MKVGIDATPAGITDSERSGVYQYILQLLHKMTTLLPDHEYHLLFALARARHDGTIRNFVEKLNGANVKTVRCRLPMRWMRRWRIPADLFLDRIDVFHALAHLAPRCWDTPIVVTIHDLSYRTDRGGDELPSGLSREARRNWYIRRRFMAQIAAQIEQTVDRARLVIAVSHATARDLVKYLGVAPEKVRVVHNGLRQDVSRTEDPYVLESIRRQYRIPPRYWLYVGQLDPNKNLLTLLEAFSRHNRGHPRAVLAVAGVSKWYRPILEHYATRLNIRDSVRFLGYVPDDDLAPLYSAAIGVVMPSPFEGFGFPALEAMACGTPVIAANAGALPEVVSDAGLLVDADSPMEFACAMEALVSDEALRSSLSAAGICRARRFSWGRAARETFAVYAEAAGCESR